MTFSGLPKPLRKHIKKKDKKELLPSSSSEGPGPLQSSDPSPSLTSLASSSARNVRTEGPSAGREDGGGITEKKKKQKKPRTVQGSPQEREGSRKNKKEKAAQRLLKRSDSAAFWGHMTNGVKDMMDGVSNNRTSCTTVDSPLVEGRHHSVIGIVNHGDLMSKFHSDEPTGISESSDSKSDSETEDPKEEIIPSKEDDPKEQERTETPPPMTEFQVNGGSHILPRSPEEVSRWLKSIGFESYSPIFLDRRVDGKMLTRLTRDDLREMGIDDIGQKRILQVIAFLTRSNGTTAPD